MVADEVPQAHSDQEMCDDKDLVPWQQKRQQSYCRQQGIRIRDSGLLTDWFDQERKQERLVPAMGNLP